MIRCPVHDIPDCSPLLNGCTLVIKLHKLERFRQFITEAEVWFLPGSVPPVWLQQLRKILDGDES